MEGWETGHRELLCPFQKGKVNDIKRSFFDNIFATWDGTNLERSYIFKSILDISVAGTARTDKFL